MAIRSLRDHVNATGANCVMKMGGSTGIIGIDKLFDFIQTYRRNGDKDTKINLDLKNITSKR